MRLVSLSMFKPSSDLVAGRSKAVLLLWINFLIMCRVFLCYAVMSVHHLLGKV